MSRAHGGEVKRGRSATLESKTARDAKSWMETGVSCPHADLLPDLASLAVRIVAPDLFLHCHLAPARAACFGCSMRRSRPTLLTRVLALAGLVLLAGCATRQMPAELRAAMQREASGLPLRAAASADGQVRIEVEAAAQPRIEPEPGLDASEASYEIDVPIGSETPIRCWLTARPVAVGATTAELASKRLFAQATAQEITGIEASVVGERPYLLVDVLGIAQEDDGRGLYHGKLFTAPVGLGALRCVHVDLGYRGTVQRVLTGLLRSLAFAPADEEQPPEYVEVSLTRVGPLTCGFNDLRAYRDPDGGWVSMQRSVLVAPRSPSEAVGVDHLRLTLADPDGTVRAASADAVSSSEDAGHSLELTRAPDGSYSVAGEVQGRRLDGAVRGPMPLRDDLSLARMAAARPEGGTFSAAQWMPEHDPLAATELTVRCQPRGESGQPCEVVSGALVLDATLDTNGMARSATVRAGGIDLELERAVSRGGF